MSKSKNSSSSSSSNQAYPFLKEQLGGVVGSGANAATQIANMLGLNGQDAQMGGFDTWKQNTGYQAGLDQGIDAITGGAATKGLLNSGSTLKALNTFGQDYASQQSGNYLNQLQQLLSGGLQAGNTIGGAGTVSRSSSSGKTKGGAGELFGGAGGLLTGIAGFK